MHEVLNSNLVLESVPFSELRKEVLYVSHLTCRLIFTSMGDKGLVQLYMPTCPQSS